MATRQLKIDRNKNIKDYLKFFQQFAVPGVKLRPIKYRDLPLDAQRSIAEYCSESVSIYVPSLKGVEGIEYTKTTDDFVAVFLSQLGSMRFCYFNVALDTIKPLYDPNDNEFKTFEDSHAWYVENEEIPNHGASRWPIVVEEPRHIREGFSFLQDGHHRFHSYVKAGDAIIPAVAFLDCMLWPGW